MKITKKSNNSQPAYISICNDIVSRIEQGEYLVGDPLPSVRASVDNYGMSLATVKRAYDWLESSGYIETYPGKGSFVSSLKGRIEPESTEWQMFWSYAHRDDELSGRAITALCKNIQNEYELQTGNTLNCFLDSDNIGWGMNWKDEISKRTTASIFFVPVITPTYLRRPNCIQELKTAIEAFKDAGLSNGIFPIFFTDAEEALSSLFDDSLVETLQTTQANTKWATLRFEDETSSAYRKEVNNIVKAIRQLEDSLSLGQSRLLQKESEQPKAIEQEEGFLDKLVEFETFRHDCPRAIDAIGETMDDIGTIFQTTSAKSSSSFSAQIKVLKDVSEAIQPLAEKLQEQCREYNSQVAKADSIIADIPEIVETVEELGTVVEADDIKGLLGQVRDLNKAADPTFEDIKEVVRILSQAGKLSRDLREPCVKIRSAMNDFCSSQIAFQRWEKIISDLYQRMMNA